MTVSGNTSTGVAPEYLLLHSTAGASEAVDARCKNENIEKKRIPNIIKTKSFCMSSPSCILSSRRR
jgi:hypothetical protein